MEPRVDKREVEYNPFQPGEKVPLPQHPVFVGGHPLSGSTCRATGLKAGTIYEVGTDPRIVEKECADGNVERLIFFAGWAECSLCGAPFKLERETTSGDCYCDGICYHEGHDEA